MSTSPSATQENDLAARKNNAIHLNLPPRFFIVPTTAFAIGALIGLRRDARLASLRFLAENAHRAPTTKEGWYYYHKTKNYKVALAGFKGAGRDGLFLAVVTLGWVGIEEGLNRVGWGQVSMIGAGLSTSALFSAICTALILRYGF